MSKSSNKSGAEPPLSLFQIAACSYEGSLFGWNVNENVDDGTHLEATMSFGFNVCHNSLRVITVSKSGKFLACGGTDERIYIYNLIEKTSVCELENHTGAITTLRFYEDSFLFSGSEVYFKLYCQSICNIYSTQFCYNLNI